MKRTLALAALLAGTAFAAPPAGNKLADEATAASTRFALTARSTVSYGSGTTWTEKTLEPGAYVCHPTTFDLPGAIASPRKQCKLTVKGGGVYVPPIPPVVTTPSTQITGQSGTVTLTAPTAIKYGGNGLFVQKTLLPGDHPCTDAYFTDPAPGVPKSCYLVGTDAPSPPQSANRAGTAEQPPVVEPPPVVTPPVVVPPPIEKPPVVSPPVVPVSDAASYRAIAATMGTDAGITYLFGSPSTAVRSATTWPGPLPDKSYADLSGQIGKMFPDGQKGNRGCGQGSGSWCGAYQIGSLTGDPLDYSSSIANVGYIPDVPPPAGFLEAKYWGVASLQVLAVAHNTVALKPEPSWTTWNGPTNNNGDNDENTLRLAGVRSGSPIGTSPIDAKPVITTKGYGRGGWTTNSLTVWSNGWMTSAGSNTAHNFVKAKVVPDGMTPTSMAITNSGEFALITAWDTVNLKGKVAVVALADGCQWCETKPESNWESNWGSSRQAYHGFPGLGNYMGAKMIGIVDLPDGMSMPTAIDVTTGKADGDYQRVRNFFNDHIQTAAQRKRYMDGDLTAAIPRTGMAVVVSKQEKRAAFIDLRPLFQYYRAQYLTPDQGAWDRMIANRGAGASQWPYTFDVAPAQKPVVTRVVALDQPPTAVKLSRHAPHRALIATQEGKLRMFDLGAKCLDQSGVPACDPSEFAETFTINVGANPTSIGYMKEHGWANKTAPFGDVKMERLWWVLSREERKATLLQFDAGMTSAGVHKSLQDSRLVDPIAIEDIDNHGTESYNLLVLDYGGKSVKSYRYGPIIMWTHADNAPCPKPNGCALDRNSFIFNGEHKLPGRPFASGVANIN